MRSLLYISLLGSFIALVHAFEASDFSIFLDDEATLDILPWEDISEENPDLSFLLANECSDFSPPFSRKRARRQNPPNFCRARTGSTAEGGQTGENDHTDDSNKPETRLDDTLTLPFLAPYFDENNNDCLRLSDGELPLAVCDVNNQGSSPDYFINGRPYWDLLYSYPKPSGKPDCGYATAYCCRSYDGISTSIRCRPLSVLPDAPTNPWPTSPWR